MHDATHADPHASGSHGNDPHAAEHGIGKYVAVFVALCVLTAMSFFTTSSYWPFHDRPQVGWAFMMAVSCTKAMLVIAFFMHLKYEADWKYVLTVPASIMSVLLILALVPDVGMRVYRYSEERKLHAADVPEPGSHGADAQAAGGHATEEKSPAAHGAAKPEKQEH